MHGLKARWWALPPSQRVAISGAILILLGLGIARTQGIDPGDLPRLILGMVLR